MGVATIGTTLNISAPRRCQRAAAGVIQAAVMDAGAVIGKRPEDMTIALRGARGASVFDSRVVDAVFAAVRDTATEEGLAHRSLLLPDEDSMLAGVKN